jgi:nitrite reductase/ring-hydroxylating ferredoxin subunit
VATVLDLSGRGNGHQDRAADTAIGIGLAGAVGAAVTGLTDWQHTVGGDRRVGMVHGLLNLSATGLYAISLALRLRGDRTAGRALGGLGFTIALGAAYLGGHLVYRKRIGVDHAPRADWDDFVTALPEAELREADPKRIDVRGVPVMLVGRAGRICALADSCAHLGGPLSEGQVDDVAVRCPWHGSRFSLDDGAVLEGPSPFSQPCFDVRVRAGQIELRTRQSS